MIDDDVLEVIDLLAEKIKFNIRELDSALLRVNSFAKVYKQPITVKFAKEVILYAIFFPSYSPPTKKEPGGS